MQVVHSGLIAVDGYIQRIAVSLTQSAGVATFNFVAHGFTVGQYIVINDANEAEYNGVHLITAVPDADNIEYVIDTAAPATATGTITGTRVTLLNAQINQLLQRPGGFKKLIFRSDPNSTEEIFAVLPGEKFGIFILAGEPFVIDIELDGQQNGLPLHGVGFVTQGGGVANLFYLLIA